MAFDVPTPVVRRLSLYLRQLEQLQAGGARTVSSRGLGSALGVTAEQVRKDLANFGQFGRSGVGYDVGALAEAMRRILKTDKTRKVIVVGAGDLGRALIRHEGFARKGFEIVAAIDIHPGKVGQHIGPVKVYHLDRLREAVRHFSVELAVLAVPAEAAQEVADLLCKAGVKGILNFAATTLRTPHGVSVSDVDLAAALEELSFRV